MPFIRVRAVVATAGLRLVFTVLTIVVVRFDWQIPRGFYPMCLACIHYMERESLVFASTQSRL